MTFNLTLPDTYISGGISSISYGLHVGSVVPKVPASLILGGYDSSRCLTEPIVANIGQLQLSKITLGVSSGGSAYVNPPPSSENFLQENGSSPEKLLVIPEPGVPYLYLPQETCDAIAKHLPVNYNKDYNLYFWDTEDKAYEEIVSSPHYIGFDFLSNNGSNSSTISVPFALLNLTLESPLKSAPTQYFPCSPWTPGNVPYHLGRAFLQAAFLAENWQTGTQFLAQAPGPDYLPQFLKTIETTDTTITPATNPPNWQSTWSSTLKALPDNVSSSGTSKDGSGKGGGSGGSGGNSGSSGLSGGAIAGIVVGAVAAIAILAAIIFWFIRRRRRRWPSPGAEKHPSASSEQSPQPEPNSFSAAYAHHGDSSQAAIIHQADSREARPELEGGSNVHELPFTTAGHDRAELPANTADHDPSK